MSKLYFTPSQVIYVCTGDKCKKRGGKDLSRLFRDLAKDHHLKHQLEVIKTDCTDRCKQAPIVCFQPQNLWLFETTEAMARKTFQEQVLQPKPKPADGEKGGAGVEL